MRKIHINGKTMWESVDGERFMNPDEKPKDKFGWRKIHVEGKVMWESPQGERTFTGE